MNTFDAIFNRRTIRRYTGEPVPHPVLEKITEAARMAASGNNRQPWEFIVATEVSIGEPDEKPEKEKKSLQQVLFWQRYPPNS